MSLCNSRRSKALPLKPLIAALGLVLSPIAAGQDTTGQVAEQASAAERNAAQTPPSPFLTVDEVAPSEQLIRDFLDARGWKQGQSGSNPGEGWLVVATENIPADPSSIDFSTARLIATEEAFLKAMGTLVSQDSVQIGKTMADRFMKDDLPEEVKDTTSLAALGDAVAGRLAEASVQTLNKVIEELGGDTAGLPQMTVAERKQLVRDEFVTETTWQAMGQLSGVGVFGVIEQTGGDGPVNNGSVSVVVVKSSRFSEFGDQLKRGEAMAGRGIPVDDIHARLDPQLEAGEPMLGYFGVQPIVDAEGRFGLLSFGMDGPALVRSMDEFAITSEMEAARRSAQMMADGWLAQFATMTVQGQSEATKRKLREQVRETRGDGSAQITTASGVGSMINSLLQSESRAQLQGVQIIGQWDAVDPATGHPYLGYVKYWSPGTAAQAQDRQRQETSPDNQRQTTTAPATSASSRSTGAFGEW